MAQLGTCSSDVAAVEKHLILRKSDVMAMGNGIAGICITFGVVSVDGANFCLRSRS